MAVPRFFWGQAEKGTVTPRVPFLSGPRADRVLTRTMILDSVWHMCSDPATNVVNVQIYRLRNKVDGEGKQALTYTIRGIGYVLKQS